MKDHNNGATIKVVSAKGQTWTRRNCISKLTEGIEITWFTKAMAGERYSFHVITPRERET